MGRMRWRSFRVVHLETDLWIAVDPGSYSPFMEEFALSRAKHYREMLDNHILQVPHFLTALTPYPAPAMPLPSIIAEMYSASAQSSTGPMSAVAGAVAEHVCSDIGEKFNVKEIVVENGGDIFMKIASQAVISVYAGTSPLSEKIGVVISPEATPLSICCSSGTVGHSFSLGRADACMIASRSGALADAWATSLANEIKDSSSVKEITETALKKTGILSVVIIKDDVAGIGGNLEVKML